MNFISHFIRNKSDLKFQTSFLTCGTLLYFDTGSFCERVQFYTIKDRSADRHGNKALIAFLEIFFGTENSRIKDFIEKGLLDFFKEPSKTGD